MGLGPALVNRVWGHLFGRGLQKDPSIDDFGSHNEIVHRELMDRLAGDFAKYNYNTKALLEWICTSDVYGLSHVATKEYADTIGTPTGVANGSRWVNRPLAGS